MSADEQLKLLEKALQVVKSQGHQMKKSLDNNEIMDGLKHCSAMLSELRTSLLTPKNYYELYMGIFDSLRYLTSYLHDAHVSSRQHLADLYELVQYAGSIVPRLYLMITVGSVYMGIADAPAKEIMKDMIEMARGVQHPTRGLFLRHYLSQVTKDHLPVGSDDGSQGSLDDTIDFILTNFIEMNKLWVRLQHQGHSRDRERRVVERKELRTLVGSNLVRLSQLEGIDLPMYRDKILPAVLEQVIICNDALAQEYLMEAIVQVFQDDFHLRTLTPFLEATARLNPKVSVRQIVSALLDRIAAYAAREAESEGQDHGEGDQKESLEKADDVSREGGTVKRHRGIPEDVHLFDVFWTQIVELVKARTDIPMQDVTAILCSFSNLCLNCYPDECAYVDRILEFARQKMVENESNPELHLATTVSNMLDLLLEPINSYPSVLTLLSLSHYQPLLGLQPYITRRDIAHAVISAALQSGTTIATTEEASGMLGLCSVLVKAQPSSGGSHSANATAPHGQEQDDDDVAEEQGWLARLIHLFQSSDPDNQYQLLLMAKKQLSEGGDRIKHTFPSLVFRSFQLARQYNASDSQDDAWRRQCTALFKLIHQLVAFLYTRSPASSDLCLRLFAMAGQTADECGLEELAYEFFVQAFTVYEESVSESKAQFQALLVIVGALQATRVFGEENYDRLATKCTLHSSRLLKRPDQCRGVYMCSHLFWAAASDKGVPKPERRRGDRVLDCLQKAIRIADSCLDSVTDVELFVEILDRYIYFFDQGVPSITPQYLNNLIESIHTNVANVEAFDFSGKNGQSVGASVATASTSSSLVQPTASLAAFVYRHLQVTMEHLAEKRALHERASQDSLSQGDLAAGRTVVEILNGPNYSMITTDVST